MADPSDESEIVLIDFGDALQITDDETYDDQTGTIFYCAPEVLDGDFVRTGRILKASDMWSFGVILYLLCCGSPPFEGRSDSAIIRAVKKAVYKWPEDETLTDEFKDLHRLQ